MGCLASRPEDDLVLVDDETRQLLVLARAVAELALVAGARVDVVGQPRAAQSRYRCVATLSGHTDDARRWRPVDTPRQLLTVLSNGRVVSGSDDDTLKVWDVSSGRCLRTLTGHTGPVRRRRLVDKTRRSLVDAATGAGLLHHRPVERPRRVRVARQHAQGVGRVDQRVPPDAERAHGPRAAPASSRHNAFDRSSTLRGTQVNCVAALPNGHVVSGSWDRTLKVWDASSGECLGTLRGHTSSARRRRPVDTTRRSLLDAATGTGLVRRRPVERPRRVRVGRRHAQGVGRVDRSVPTDADRARGPRAMPVSSRTTLLIARRRRDGRRSMASLSCRTATLCPDHGTARSGSGKMARGNWHGGWHVWLPSTVYLK